MHIPGILGIAKHSENTSEKRVSVKHMGLQTKLFKQSLIVYLGSILGALCAGIKHFSMTSCVIAQCSQKIKMRTDFFVSFSFFSYSFSLLPLFARIISSFLWPRLFGKDGAWFKCVRGRKLFRKHNFRILLPIFLSIYFS